MFAALVLIAGGYVIASEDHRFDPPSTTTTISRDAVSYDSAFRKTTEVTTRSKGKPKTTETTTVVNGSPATKATTQVEGERSFFERVLGDAGLVFLQIALLLALAFLVGAAIQRALVGEYGGFKFGTFELTALAGASNDGIDKLKAALKKLRKDAAMDGDVASLRAELNAAIAESKAEDAATSSTLALIAERLAAVEKRLP